MKNIIILCDKFKNVSVQDNCSVCAYNEIYIKDENLTVTNIKESDTLIHFRCKYTKFRYG